MTTPIDDIISSFTDGLLDKLLSVLGREALTSVFVAGSAACGEVSYAQVGGKTEIYSDVDVYVVVTDPAGLERARKQARVVVGEHPLAGADYVFLRSPDVGVYSFEDLMGQAARPGTVDIAGKNRVLYGDESIPRQTADFIGRNIAPTEGLYLLENRLSELAAFLRGKNRTGGEAARRRFNGFLLCKTCADVVTAVLVAFGRYEPSRRNRLVVFESLVSDGKLEGGLNSEQLDLIRLGAGVLDGLPDSAGSLAGGIADGAGAVTRATLDAWKFVGSVCWADKSDDWRSMVRHRCRIGEYLHNSRQYLVVSGRFGVKRVNATKSIIHMARYSPRDTLRLAALVGFLAEDPATAASAGEIKQSIDPFLDRLTRICGFTDGTLDERTGAMHAAVR